jgi:hypothetical protein
MIERRDTVGFSLRRERRAEFVQLRLIVLEAIVFFMITLGLLYLLMQPLAVY